MNFEQARELSFLVPWKIAECFSGPQCWCRRIVPVEPILYTYTRSSDYEEEYEIVGDAAIDQKTAEYIVRLHNNKIEQDKTISDSMTKILQEQPVQDYGISQ